MSKRNQNSREQALLDLYAELPRMQCQGLCADSCASMGMTVLEQRVIRVRTGRSLPLAHAGSLCPALTMLRQCSIYEVRPTICRLWGMVPAMRCNYGCTPEGGWLTDAQAYEFLARVAELGGDHEAAEGYRAPFRDDLAPVAGRFLRRLQMERDLSYQRQVKDPRSIHVATPGRIVPKRK